MTLINFDYFQLKLPLFSAKAAVALLRYLRILTFSKSVLRSPPLFMQIEPTSICNLACSNCTRPQTPSAHAEISASQLDYILSRFPSIKFVKLQGLGEPLLHSQFHDLVKVLHSRGVSISTTTNGTLLASNPHFCESICDHMFNTSVSIDALTPVLFEKLRKGAKFDEVINGLRCLAFFRGKRSFPLIGINFVASHINYSEIDKLYKICTDLQIDYVTIVPVENWTTPLDNIYEKNRDFIKSSREKESEIIKRYHSLKKKLIRVGTYVQLKKKKGGRLGKCFWPFQAIYISADGYIKPCCMRMHHKYSLGNVFDQVNVNDLWNGPQYQLLRLAHMSGDRTNVVCGNCPD